MGQAAVRGGLFLKKIYRPGSSLCRVRGCRSHKREVSGSSCGERMTWMEQKF